MPLSLQCCPYLVVINVLKNTEHICANDDIQIEGGYRKYSGERERERGHLAKISTVIAGLYIHYSILYILTQYTTKFAIQFSNTEEPILLLVCIYVYTNYTLPVLIFFSRLNAYCRMYTL